MADIFISYSSKDRAQAEQLTELLSSAGLSVWIDRQGIDAATSWSGEITKAITDCIAFVVLLSPASMSSANVSKEISLASERKKKILPLDIEPVELPDDVAYHLAGIQHTPMTNIDSILRALNRLGLKASAIPQAPKLVNEVDDRKSLMILPFADLSPTADNEWFADGIVSELIQALSQVKSIRIIDSQTTKDFKHFRGPLAYYAKEMRVRYFVEGEVRKFGNQIKINSRLFDIETADHLWQDSFHGVLEDIFSIQERVAKNIVEGLHLLLSSTERSTLAARKTENAEAYELWLKGNEYFRRHSKNGYEMALSLFAEAIRLDPQFTTPYLKSAHTLIETYRTYSRDAKLLEYALQLTNTLATLEGESVSVLWLRSKRALVMGDTAKALAFALEAHEVDPGNTLTLDGLAFAYESLGKLEEAADIRKQAAEGSQRDNPSTHFSYLMTLHELGDEKRLQEAAAIAIPIFERHIRLSPDDFDARANFISILTWCGHTEQALAGINQLEVREGLDGVALYNLSCSYALLGKPTEALRLLEQAVERGFGAIEAVKNDPDLDALRSLPEYDRILRKMNVANG